MKKLLYEITHTTSYDYMGDVSVSHHLLRLAPRDSGRQNCLAHALTIHPEPKTRSVHRDYFGNPTHFIGIEFPHQRIVITAQSRVAVSPAFIPESAETPAWETVHLRSRNEYSAQGLAAPEFLHASPLVTISDEFGDYTRS